MRGEYKQMRTTVFLRLVLLLFVDVVLIYVLYDVILHGRFANWVVGFLNY